MFKVRQGGVEMKASEFIATLQEHMKKYGDLDLLFRNPDCKGYRKAYIHRALCNDYPYKVFVIDLDK